VIATFKVDKIGMPLILIAEIAENSTAADVRSNSNNVRKLDVQVHQKENREAVSVGAGTKSKPNANNVITESVQGLSSQMQQHRYQLT